MMTYEIPDDDRAPYTIAVEHVERLDKRIAELEVEVASMVPKAEYDEVAEYYDLLVVTFSELKAENAKLEAERERLRRALRTRFQKEEEQLIDAHRQEVGRVWARIACMEGYAD